MAQEGSSSKVILKKQKIDPLLIFIVYFAVISYGRIYFLYDFVWDDNCWLLAAYASKDIESFLNTGWFELRRIAQGMFTYYLLSLHKSSNYAHVIWHSLNMAVQIFTPVFLYLFLNKLFKEKQILSFFAAISLIVFPLDFTLPYLTAISYRIATLLSVVSLYFTARAFEKNGTHHHFYLMAILTSGVSYYIFMEVTVVFEVARLFIIGYMLSHKDINYKLFVKRTILFWLPFFLFCIPLIIYKLTFKPYGIYEGVYKTNFLFPLEWKEHVKMIRILLFYQWKILLEYFGEARIWTIIISILAGSAGFVALLRLSNIIGKMVLQSNEILKDVDFKERIKRICQPIAPVLLLGMLCFLPLIVLLEFAGREIGPGFNSSHFNQLQIGYAIIIGSGLYIIYMAFNSSLFIMRLTNLSIALLIGFGVFFNNLNLDLYSNASKKQMQFWTIFTERFPNLPKEATILMDVRDFYYFDTPDLDNSYDLELYLNLLYAESDDPSQFRKYKALAMEEFKPEMARDSCNNLQQSVIKRISHFGEDVLKPCEFIVVRYSNNELLVNREIVKQYPNIPYKNWADKDFPQLPQPVFYPLRHKLIGFN